MAPTELRNLFSRAVWSKEQEGLSEVFTNPWELPSTFLNENHPTSTTDVSSHF